MSAESFFPRHCAYSWSWIIGLREWMNKSRRRVVRALGSARLQQTSERRTQRQDTDMTERQHHHRSPDTPPPSRRVRAAGAGRPPANWTGVKLQRAGRRRRLNQSPSASGYKEADGSTVPSRRDRLYTLISRYLLARVETTNARASRVQNTHRVGQLWTVRVILTSSFFKRI